MFVFLILTLGWGKTIGGEGQPGANYLQQAMLPVADDRICQYVNGRLATVYSNTMICAGGQGRGGCQVKIEDSDMVYIVVTFKRDVALNCSVNF